MRFTSIPSLLLSAVLSLGAGAVLAEGLPPAMQSKTESYKAKLVEWAANAKGPGGMSNGKWNDLDEKDPTVTAYETSPAGVLISKWEADKNLSKLVLRDEKGNLVAASLKPVVFNNAARPPFANAIKGSAWFANEVKPDPASGVKGVHVSAPVLDGGTAIGVLHTSVTVD